MSGSAIPSAAASLLGTTLADGWHVVSKWEPAADRTAAEFSIGYLARHSSGALGYVKALDFADALSDDDPVAALGRMLDAFRFERDLLERCGDRRLSRVVRVLASGTARVPDRSPEAVSFLIMELADGDARDLLDLSDPADCLHRLKAAHHAAVGLEQLHGVGVSHQDVKPANLLTWRDEAVTHWESKLGDLGRAFDPSHPAPHDDLTMPGDPLYAAPELLYLSGPRVLRWRAAEDMYMFGNLLCFLVSGVSFGGIQSLYLERNLNWSKFNGTFAEVYPYLLDAYELGLSRLEQSLHKEAAQDVTAIVRELCHPAPERRGDPVAHRRNQNPYSLKRYVTRIDLLISNVSLRRARSND